MKNFFGIVLGVLIGLMSTMSILFLADHTSFTVYRLDFGMTIVLTSLILILSGMVSKLVSNTHTTKSAWGWSFITLVIVEVVYFLIANFINKGWLINSRKPVTALEALILPIFFVSLVSAISFKDD